MLVVTKEGNSIGRIDNAATMCILRDVPGHWTQKNGKSVFEIDEDKEYGKGNPNGTIHISLFLRKGTYLMPED